MLEDELEITDEIFENKINLKDISKKDDMDDPNEIYIRMMDTVN